MEYQDFVQPVQGLGFISNSEHADSATKAVLGMLASRLQEPEARQLTENLPEPLTLDLLRGRQKYSTEISVDQYLAALATELRINPDQASQLVETVLHTTKQAVGDDSMAAISSTLPLDWSRTIGRA